MSVLKVKYEELEHQGFDTGGVEILYFNGNPFTGFSLIIEERGWISLEEEYQNGYQEGIVREYDESGQLEVEYKMQNNVLVPDTTIHFNDDGSPRDQNL